MLSAVLLALFGAGCVYFNTFFMARQKFEQAEKSQEQNEVNRKTGGNNQSGRNQTPGRLDERNPARGGGRQGRIKSSDITISKVNAQERLLYEDAIKKASKVLKFHPESKWVDDALWLIGKSYYNMGDYLLADRKFKELVINHPSSKYADDAYFYSGICQLELGNIELGNLAFSEIENNYTKSPYIDDVYFVRGAVAMKNENYTSAIDHFTLYLRKFPKNDSSAAAMYYTAICQERLGDHLKAYKTFDRVKKYKPSMELYFDASLASASSALKTDSIDTGMRILIDLAGNERYFSSLAKIRLKIAEGYFLKGEIEQSIDEYNTVTSENPKSEEAAEAYYRLGLIYQNNLFDIEAAKNAFSKAQSENMKSDYRNLALAKSAQIAKLESYLIQLQRADSARVAEQSKLSGVDVLADTSDTLFTPDRIEQPSTARDTLLSETDSSVNINPEDMRGSRGESLGEIDPLLASESGEEIMPGVSPMPLPGDLPELPAVPSDSLSDSLKTITDISNSKSDSSRIDSLSGGLIPAENLINKDSLEAVRIARDDSIRQEIIKSGIETRFLLAELYGYELNRPDSALREYILLIDEHPKSIYSPRALLASANIEFSRDDTGSGNRYLRRLINDYPKSPQAAQASEILDYPLDLSENAMGLYARAESLIYLADYPESAIVIFDFIADNFPDLAPKAAYAKAWTLDRIIGVTDSSAFLAYANVNKKYPYSPFSKAAKIRIGLESRPEKKIPQRRDRGENEKRPEEDQFRADSLKSLAMDMPEAPSILRLGEFLYPEELLYRDLKGEVLFKIKIDISGRITDYEILGPSGERAIDSSATAALLETEFDTSRLDFAMLDSYFRYSIPFERPEVNIHNNPYLDRRERP